MFYHAHTQIQFKRQIVEIWLEPAEEKALLMNLKGEIDPFSTDETILMNVSQHRLKKEESSRQKKRKS